MGSCCTVRTHNDFMDESRATNLSIKKSEEFCANTSADTYIKQKDKSNMKPNDIAVFISK